MKKIILLLFVLVLAACSVGQQTELSRNQAKWEDSGITSYSYELNVSCFCPFRSQMPVTMVVQDGEVVSMTDATGTPVAQTDPMYEYVAKYATIDGMFAELNSQAVQEADKVTVTYDPTYGYPTEIVIDYIELATDDEMYISVTNFEPLP